ncbi:hypothetical protein HYPSUDRAFT_111787, partial [Hypholoma sublateritium FD-334 SS-4]
YSPNSSRTVEEPPIRMATENPFIPPLAWQILVNPRWWTREWGWVAFMPHDLELDLTMAAFLLQGHYDAPAIRPMYPAGFGYKKSYPRENAIMKSIHKARDWFSVWMGLLSFLIAMAETKEHELHDYAHLSKKGWADYLLEQGAERTWLESLINSQVFRFEPGVNDRFSASWNLFLLSRESLRQRIEHAETSLDKHKRLSREKRPPIKSAKVFYWVKDVTSDGYIRKQVSKKWHEDTLSDYSAKQIRYDSHFNEWDCSSEFGSDDESDGSRDDDERSGEGLY